MCENAKKSFLAILMHSSNLFSSHLVLAEVHILKTIAQILAESWRVRITKHCNSTTLIYGSGVGLSDKIITYE